MSTISTIDTEATLGQELLGLRPTANTARATDSGKAQSPRVKPLGQHLQGQLIGGHATLSGDSRQTGYELIR